MTHLYLLKNLRTYTTINDFAECLNQKGQCDVLLLDFSKAFDKVAHTCLF